MNELAVAGAAIGGLVLLSSASSSTSSGDTVNQHAGDAATAAMNYLRANQPIAGVSFNVPDTNSPASTYKQMRDAMVGAWGQLTGVAGVYPREMTPGALYEILNTWIGAYAAGCHATSAAMQDFSIGGDWPGTCESAACSSLDNAAVGDNRTPLGKAVCDAATLRDSLDTRASADLTGATLATSDQITSVFRAVNALASEMDAADYTFAGIRQSDKSSIGDVAGGLGAAWSASVGAVESIAGKAASAVGGAIVGSSLFWVVGLGLVGYFVLRRSA